MSPARIALAALFVSLLAPFAWAAGGQYPRDSARPEKTFFFVSPVLPPNYTTFRETLLRDLMMARMGAPRKFSVPPGEAPLTAPVPGKTTRRDFSFPPVAGWRRPPDVCYAVRSYLYARETRDSDVVIPAGYRECTPSAQFQVKRVDLPR
jgi:hypothetical protein